jgi:S-disulfanyl-L-cysteine oxidoreductase SoxD
MSRLLFLFAAIVAGGAIAAQPVPLGIGRTVEPAEIAKRSISVAPDGQGLPPGSGSVAAGRKVYAEQCASCHGDKGQGSEQFPRLVGGQGTLATAKPVQTIGSFWPYATTVWDYIYRAMPYQNPVSMKADDVYAVTAYLLYENGIVDERTVLNRDSLPRIKMPNRDGFVSDPRPDLPAKK